MSRVYLLSPANCRGARAGMILREDARSELARRLRTPEGAPLGEVFAFMSGLYFRGKLSYATHYASPPPGVPGVLVITPSEGLRPVGEAVDALRLRAWAAVDLVRDVTTYRPPLLRDARALDVAAAGCEIVLLGSVASAKYVEPLLEVFGGRLRFPSEFVGRGDMSRGGLLLRCVGEGRRLSYVPALGARRHGPRPPRLEPQDVEAARSIQPGGPRPHVYNRRRSPGE